MANSTDVQTEIKLCGKCKKNPRARATSSWCLDCNAEWMRNKRATNPTYSREENLLHKYGMTIADYEAKLAAQGGVCACCGREPREAEVFHVDHDHKCCPGKTSCGECIRDLLCVYCNTTVGKLESNTFFQQELYLARWSA